MLAVVTAMLSGCSNAKLINELQTKCAFKNNYENAMKQTEIFGLVNDYFNQSETLKKKCLLITIDGMRAESLKYIYSYKTGIAKIAQRGGLYWTLPDNVDTKARVDLGVNFLNIMTGKEPSTYDVLKSTDAKRADPISIITQVSKQRKTLFLTDNQGYIDFYLKQELQDYQNSRLNVYAENEMIDVKDRAIRGLGNNDFIVIATSLPYYQAKQKFSMKNSEYLSSILNLNTYIDEIFNKINARVNEEWCVIVASTFGGVDPIASDNDEQNTMTFMSTNKKL